ncbi:MAG: dUTP diphosphatase [Candidatus Thorarchaeota archaeon]|nr:dUTP diphosphatase [Candidatus Thorarchaeota archaeon]
MTKNEENADVEVRVRRVHHLAQMPAFAHDGDTCVDLYAVEDKVIYFGRQAAVDIGIQIALPRGWEAQIRPRSGLALKNGITVENSPGTIDSGYRGNIKIIMNNDKAGEPYHVRIGDKIAQMAIRRVPTVEFIEVDELDETERGVNGFGSTGK